MADDARGEERARTRDVTRGACRATERVASMRGVL